MEGFGSDDLTTPFHYGSVHDGEFRSDSLEQKLKKTYYKTKQAVIQKLGKEQDEFIIAGDAEIDTKLEVWMIHMSLMMYWSDSCLFAESLSSPVFLYGASSVNRKIHRKNKK